VTISPIQRDTHSCDLPYAGDSEWSHGDLIRCDVCGQRYILDRPPGWEWTAEWNRISRFDAWLVTRREKKNRRQK
jgi:hypothetical protein